MNYKKRVRRKKMSITKQKIPWVDIMSMDLSRAFYHFEYLSNGLNQILCSLESSNLHYNILQRVVITSESMPMNSLGVGV